MPRGESRWSSQFRVSQSRAELPTVPARLVAGPSGTANAGLTGGSHATDLATVWGNGRATYQWEALEHAPTIAAWAPAMSASLKVRAW
jgi:hypothetical protein